MQRCNGSHPSSRFDQLPLASADHRAADSICTTPADSICTTPACLARQRVPHAAGQVSKALEVQLRERWRQLGAVQLHGAGRGAVGVGVGGR